MEPVDTSSTELPGFEKVNLENLSEETLTIEDLKSRKNQLWLIKVPYEFDISKLSDTTVILNGTQELSIKTTDQDTGKRYESRASKYSDEQCCPYEVVVPSKEGNSLQVAKSFTGHLDILQTVKVPTLVYPPTPPPMYTDIPRGLQARWKPFGWRSPPEIKRKSKKERKKDREKQSGVKRKELEVKKNRSGKLNEEENLKDKVSPKKKKKKKEPEEQPKFTTKDKHKRKRINP